MSTNTTKSCRIFFFHFRGFQKSKKHERLAGNGVFRRGPMVLPLGIKQKVDWQHASMHASYQQQTLRVLSSPSSGLWPGSNFKVWGQGGTSLVVLGQRFYCWLSSIHCGFYLAPQKDRKMPLVNSKFWFIQSLFQTCMNRRLQPYSQFAL